MSPTSSWSAHGGGGWQAQPVDEARVAALAAEIGVRRLTAAILLGRGLGDSARASRFLTPRLADLRRPEGMADLERTLDRLTQALARQSLAGCLAPQVALREANERVIAEVKRFPHLEYLLASSFLF